jgi:hypothetical protein
MSKKTNKKVIKSSQNKQQNSTKKYLICMLGWRSMVTGILVAVLLYNVIQKNNGYKWITQSLLKGNWELIRKHPNATLTERYQAKLGFDYSFLNYINERTPDTAIILFPSSEHITEKGGNMQLSSNITNKLWVTHFVYPRRILYKTEQGTNPLYDSVTHVAICAACGYEDLNYEITQRSYYDILPKQKENINIK